MQPFLHNFYGKTFLRRLSFVLLATANFFLISCESDVGDTGIGILPAGDIIELRFSDTATINMETQLIGGTPTGFASRQLLGTYIDPEFGVISSSIFTQFDRETDLWDFNLSLSPQREQFFQIDSVVFQIEFTAATGAFETPQQLKCFAISDGAFFPDSTDQLNSDLSLAVEPQDLCPTPEDCLLDFSSDTAFFGSRIFRMKLDKSIGERLIFADSIHYETSQTFAEFFKGLNIVPPENLSFSSRTPGAIFASFLSSSNSTLTVHYQSRDSLQGTFQPQLAEFPITGITRRYHRVTRSDFEQRALGLTLADPAKADVNEFIQEGNLIRILVTLPGLADIGLVGVNRAEFNLFIDDSFEGSTVYDPPESIAFVTADENGDPVLDAGGNPEVITRANLIDGGYRLLLTNYIQGVATGRIPNNGFVILSTNFSSGIERMILGGPNHPTLAPNLILTLTTNVD